MYKHARITLNRNNVLPSISIPVVYFYFNCPKIIIKKQQHNPIKMLNMYPNCF